MIFLISTDQGSANLTPASLTSISCSTPCILTLNKSQFTMSTLDTTLVQVVGKEVGGGCAAVGITEGGPGMLSTKICSIFISLLKSTRLSSRASSKCSVPSLSSINIFTFSSVCSLNLRKEWKGGEESSLSSVTSDMSSAGSASSTGKTT